jgi:DNA-binding IclR family transcriptional regulator
MVASTNNSDLHPKGRKWFGSGTGLACTLLVWCYYSAMQLPAQPNQSLIDGLTVLQAVAGGSQPVGSRELARELGIEPTRTNRLLKTLAHVGLTEQGEDRKYRVGPAIHVLAAQALFGSGLLRRAMPHLETLHTHGLIVALGVLWRDQVSYLYHAEPGMNAGVALGRAGLFPAARSGIGVALLARQAGTHPHDPGLAALVDHARREGYAFVPVGSTNGQPVHSLGVAIPGPGATAIALSGRIVPGRIPGLVASLKAVVATIADATVNSNRQPDRQPRPGSSS